MKTLTPDFNVRFSFKSIKIKSLYTKNSKPFICKLDTCNVIYQFRCNCNKSYVGRTIRVLRIRAAEHRTFSRDKNTNYHIHRCPVYIKKLLEYEKIHKPHNPALIPKPKLGIISLWTILQYSRKISKLTLICVEPKLFLFECIDLH